MKIQFNRNYIRRPALIVSALALTVVSLVPLVDGSSASAGQVTTRFIQLSDATPAATGVSYNVSFKPTSTATIGGIVVDICSDLPIVGNTTCAYPAGFSFGGATPTTSGAPTGFSTSTGSWVTTNSLAGGAGAGRQIFKYTNATPQTPTGVGTAINFTVTAVVNPNAVGSFYARIATFNTDTNAINSYTGAGTVRAANPMTGMLDYGGIALSTVTAVNISATVRENLTFCVNATAPGTGCSTLTTPINLTLGTGTPRVLDAASVYTDTAHFQLTTNAYSGVDVNLKVTSSATCAGLSADGGSTCPIAGQGAFAALAAGSGKFGINVADSTGGSGTNVVHNANYGTTGGSYGMGTATYGTYGDTIASLAAANVCTDKDSTITYAASALATTPAGVYSQTESLIAVGRF